MIPNQVVRSINIQICNLPFVGDKDVKERNIIDRDKYKDFLFVETYQPVGNIQKDKKTASTIPFGICVQILLHHYITALSLELRYTEYCTNLDKHVFEAIPGVWVMPAYHAHTRKKTVCLHNYVIYLYLHNCIVIYICSYHLSQTSTNPMVM